MRIRWLLPLAVGNCLPTPLAQADPPSRGGDLWRNRPATVR